MIPASEIEHFEIENRVFFELIESMIFFKETRYDLKQFLKTL